MAYVLMAALRRIGLAGGRFADATCGTIRLKLLKIGALVRLSVQRLKLAMPSVFPYQQDYRSAYVLLGADDRLRPRQRKADIDCPAPLDRGTSRAHEKPLQTILPSSESNAELDPLSQLPALASARNPS